MDFPSSNFFSSLSLITVSVTFAGLNSAVGDYKNQPVMNQRKEEKKKEQTHI